VGLKPTSITRDLDWGIPVPLEDWKGKSLYVWFEAVMGYLSSAIEWSKLTGNNDAWRDWWIDPSAKAFYFIGKDNITFHAVTGQLNCLVWAMALTAGWGRRIHSRWSFRTMCRLNEFYEPGRQEDQRQS
jgi:hypothetical protein